MDEPTNHEPARLRRHSDRDLPRHWISLPEPIARRALEDPLLSGLFPSHVGYFPRAGSHGIARERPLTSSIFNYCVRGRGWCSVANARHLVGPGDLMVIPGGEPHAYGTDPNRPWTLHWFHAMGTNLPRLIEQLGVTPRSPVVHLGRAPELEALFNEVREALEDDYSAQQLLYSAQVLGHLMGVMTRLQRRKARAEASAAQRVLATLEHVKRHLAVSHGVGELAARADLSPSHYSELVRSATGYPPKEYLTRLRMHRAARLLDGTELAIKTIAREVGFADPLHFSRVFRRINEQSPRHYRTRGSRGQNAAVAAPALNQDARAPSPAAEGARRRSASARQPSRTLGKLGR